jgi:hypothetical protein
MATRQLSTQSLEHNVANTTAAMPASQITDIKMSLVFENWPPID